jgi:hypothetical protein
MVDRVTFNVATFMKVQGQWVIVLPGSVIDVDAASNYAASSLSAVVPGTGTLLNGTHNNPFANYRMK